MKMQHTLASVLLLASIAVPVSHADEKSHLAALEVVKTATCGCCKKWVDHAQSSGLTIHARDVPYPDLKQLKDKLGIAPQQRSCHTATSPDGYVFEGHIPAKLIKQFLLAPPAGALGLSVPAMPLGSPGMEYKGGFMPYKVHVLFPNGRTEVYAELNHYEAQF